jgi:hypothetical protein
MADRNLSGAKESRKKLDRIIESTGFHRQFLLSLEIPVLLQILLRPTTDAIECFLDVLDRVGHAEA